MPLKKTDRKVGRKFQCGKCGNLDTWQKVCPATAAKCHKCGRINHFARVCRWNSKKIGKPKLHNIEQNSSDEGDSMYIVMVNDNTETVEWEVSIKLNEQMVTFKIDMGAQCRVISKETYDWVCQWPLMESQAKLTAFWGHRVSACGKTMMVCEYKGTYIPVELEVIKQDVPSVLAL